MGGAVSFQIVHHVAEQNRGPDSKRLEKQSDNILDVLATENNWFWRLLRNCLFTLQFSFEKAFCANHGEIMTCGGREAIIWKSGEKRDFAVL